MKEAADLLGISTNLLRSYTLGRKVRNERLKLMLNSGLKIKRGAEEITPIQENENNPLENILSATIVELAASAGFYQKGKEITVSDAVEYLKWWIPLLREEMKFKQTCEELGYSSPEQLTKEIKRLKEVEWDKVARDTLQVYSN
jgi:hypothetical protein